MSAESTDTARAMHEIPEHIRLAGRIMAEADLAEREVLTLEQKPDDERYKGCGQHQEWTGMVSKGVRLSAGTAKMVAPLYLAYHNGGIPSKKAGARLKIGPLEITGETAFRAILMSLVVVAVVLLAGIRVKVDSEGNVTVGKSQHVTLVK